MLIGQFSRDVIGWKTRVEFVVETRVEFVVG